MLHELRGCLQAGLCPYLEPDSLLLVPILPCNEAISSTSIPTSLGTTCVKVGDVKAFLTYVSSTQLNFRAGHSGELECGRASDRELRTGNKLKGIRWIISIQPAAPEFLYWIHLPNGRSPIVAVDAITI